MKSGLVWRCRILNLIASRRFVPHAYIADMREFAESRGLKGRTFVVEETSPNVYCITGTHVSGKMVRHIGSGLVTLYKLATDDARSLMDRKSA